MKLRKGNLPTEGVRTEEYRARFFSFGEKSKHPSEAWLVKLRKLLQALPSTSHDDLAAFAQKHGMVPLYADAQKNAARYQGEFAGARIAVNCFTGEDLVKRFHVECDDVIVATAYDQSKGSRPKWCFCNDVLDVHMEIPLKRLETQKKAMSRIQAGLESLGVSPPNVNVKNGIATFVVRMEAADWGAIEFPLLRKFPGAVYSSTQVVVSSGEDRMTD